MNAAGDEEPEGAVSIKVQLPGSRENASLVRERDGRHWYIVRGLDGSSHTLTPEQFAERVYASQSSRTLLAVVFNVSTPIGLLWVSLGLLGQVLFTGRMIVQWVASEKSQRSVVPPIFWWMSLIGAMMLLTYFLWRRDVVGILGQGIGLAVYVRNLHLIYMSGPQTTAVIDASDAQESVAVATR
jgi:lipid-A-disaccharide synthase-like uncharacterized protein